MGILPLQFREGESAASLGLAGEESYDISGMQEESPDSVSVTATRPDGSQLSFEARVRIDTPQEFEYYRNGGILHYVLRQLAA
jgi:aconitate hydratase